MCKIISFFSNKGGTGKTTLTYNVGADLSFNHNKRVLVIDADSQMNLTASMFGLSDTIEYSEENNKKWKEYLDKYLSFVNLVDDNKEKTIFSYQKHREANKENIDLFNNNNIVFDLLLADEDYFDFENTINSYLRDFNLRKEAVKYFSNITKKIKELSKNYDFILIDCSPSANSALNAFFILSSNYFICPLRCDFFSYQSIGKLKRIIANWEDLFRIFQTDDYKNCIDMQEKFIGIVVSETRKVVSETEKNNKTKNKQRNISQASQKWVESVNSSIKNYTTSAIGREKSITEEEFKNIFEGAIPFIITDKTCNYTGVMKNIIDQAGIPLILLNGNISKKFYKNKDGTGRNVLSETKYKENFNQYKEAINTISKGLIKLK